MRRYFILFTIIILNYIIQSTLLHNFEILGATPNTALIIVTCFAILQGKNKGAIIGFFTGMLQDIFLGNVIGINSLSYMLIGYGMGNLEKFIFKDNFLNPIFFTAISTAIYYFLFNFILYLTNYTIDIMDIIRPSFLIEIIYNGILAMFFYRFAVYLTRRLDIGVKTR